MKNAGFLYVIQNLLSRECFKVEYLSVLKNLRNTSEVDISLECSLYYLWPHLSILLPYGQKFWYIGRVCHAKAPKNQHLKKKKF